MQALKADSTAKQPYWHAFLAGSSCAFITVAFNQPLDVMKTKMMNQNRNAPLYNSAVHCAQLTVRDSGLKALWSGSVPRLCRQIPTQAITFGTFNIVCDLLERSVVR